MMNPVNPIDLVLFTTKEGAPVDSLKPIDKLAYLDNVLEQLQNTLTAIADSEDFTKVSPAFLRTQLMVDEVCDRIGNTSSSIANENAENFRRILMSMNSQLTNALTMYLGKMNQYEQMATMRAAKILVQFFDQITRQNQPEKSETQTPATSAAIPASSGQTNLGPKKSPAKKSVSQSLINRLLSPSSASLPQTPSSALEFPIR